jgi:hypothetical protein
MPLGPPLPQAAVGMMPLGPLPQAAPGMMPPGVMLPGPGPGPHRPHLEQNRQVSALHAHDQQITELRKEVAELKKNIQVMEGQYMGLLCVYVSILTDFN